MEIFTINNLSFRFPATDNWVIRDLSMAIKEGEFVVLGGPSGCGKTTLLRLLKKELAPVGETQGDIMYAGKLLESWDAQTSIEEIGFVFQDPDNQIVMDDVMQEIVFGMENLGYSTIEMRKRVAEMVHFFGLEDLLQAKPSELSGGQKQMLNLLSVLLLQPRVLLLDEPTSQLDPVAAKDLLNMLERLNEEMGITIILVEHRLEELFAVADRIMFMKDGKIEYDGPSREVIFSLYEKGDEQFLSYIPSLSQIYLKRVERPIQQKIPLTVKECRQWLSSLTKENRDQKEKVISQSEETVLSLKNVSFRYEKQGSLILKNLSLTIRQGEYFALVGGNGSGKTTALKVCTGIVKPQRGSVQLFRKDASKLKGKDKFGKIAYLPQNPRAFFVHDTIEKEMIESAQRLQLHDSKAKIDAMLELFQITRLRERHPHDCSGGEMQKAALACMLLSKPDILFIDEPTKGLDPISKSQFATLLQNLHEEGLTIVMVTHDIEFAAKYAERCAMMFNGDITVEGTPNELFKGNYFYTTAINRATRGDYEVLTLEEAVELWPVPMSI